MKVAMNIDANGHLKICVNHKYTNKKILDTLEYYFITQENLIILEDAYRVTGTAYDINTKNDIYTLELIEKPLNKTCVLKKGEEFHEDRYRNTKTD